MGWIACVCWLKLWCDFVARTSSLIKPDQPILQRVPCSNETMPNAPKHNKMLQNMSLVPMGWIGCVHCEKLWCDFVARTSSLIAPVQPILHRVPCSDETLPNAPKHYKMIQNKSLVPIGWIECVRCPKFLCEFVARTFVLIAPVQPISPEFHAITKQSKMHPNTTKCTNWWV